MYNNIHESLSLILYQNISNSITRTLSIPKASSSLRTRVTGGWLLTTGQKLNLKVVEKDIQLVTDTVQYKQGMIFCSNVHNKNLKLYTQSAKKTWFAILKCHKNTCTILCGAWHTHTVWFTVLKRYIRYKTELHTCGTNKILSNLTLPIFAWSCSIRCVYSPKIMGEPQWRFYNLGGYSSLVFLDKFSSVFCAFLKSICFTLCIFRPP